MRVSQPTFTPIADRRTKPLQSSWQSSNYARIPQLVDGSHRESATQIKDGDKKRPPAAKFPPWGCVAVYPIWWRFANLSDNLLTFCSVRQIACKCRFSTISIPSLASKALRSFVRSPIGLSKLANRKRISGAKKRIHLLFPLAKSRQHKTSGFQLASRSLQFTGP